ncbi:hypothetical protein [Micromonospora sp. RTGN7]|uniref:hypothetical protein n=1 Tax=Micromonospora sp. RTGN7 TaxID=3016526 RepID=UPI0029FF3F7B|nr:hypothetical protein [Micromonospora sp. RTGN7]
MRRTLPSLAMIALACLLTAGCGDTGGSPSSAGTTTAPAADEPVAPAEDDPEPAPATTGPTAGPKPTVAGTPVAPPKPAPKKVPALTCKQLAGAHVGSTKVPYQGYADYLPLSEGVWSGEDGDTVTLQKACGIGDLDDDGAADAVGAVALKSGGTGTFYTLVVWHNADGEPVYQSVAELDDRTPVVSITVSGGKAKVVWLTRSAERGMAELDIRRTSIYQLSGSTFSEVSHTDEAYKP